MDARRLFSLSQYIALDMSAMMLTLSITQKPTSENVFRTKSTISINLQTLLCARPCVRGLGRYKDKSVIDQRTFSHYAFFFFYFLATPKHVGFPVQGSDLSHSPSCSNSGSFNPLSWSGIQPEHWCCISLCQSGNSHSLTLETCFLHCLILTLLIDIRHILLKLIILFLVIF